MSKTLEHLHLNLEGPARQRRHARVFSTHSDTQAGPAFHCVYECLEAFFRHASVFKTRRHAVYQCLKKPPIFFRRARVFKTLVSTRACFLFYCQTYGLHMGHLSRKRRKSRKRHKRRRQCGQLKTRSWVLDSRKSRKPRKWREPRESRVQTTGSPNNGFRDTRFWTEAKPGVVPKVEGFPTFLAKFLVLGKT